MALYAVVQVQRVHDVDVRDEHDRVGAGGHMLAGLHVAGLQQDGRADVMVLKERILHQAHAVAGTHGDELLVLRLGDLNRRAVLKAVRQLRGARGHEHDLLVLDQDVLQFVGLFAGGDQRDVTLALGGHPLQRVAAVLHQLHRDIGIPAREFRDDQRQKLQSPLHRDAHADAAVDFGGHLGELRAQIPLDVQHLLRRIHVLVAGVGQGDGVRAAVKDGRAQILLDLLDRLGEGGLGDVELLAGGGDGALAKDGQHILNVLHVHGKIASRSFDTLYWYTRMQNHKRAVMSNIHKSVFAL